MNQEKGFWICLENRANRTRCGSESPLVPDPRSRGMPLHDLNIEGWGGVEAMGPTGCPCVQAIPGGYRSPRCREILTLKC